MTATSQWIAIAQLNRKAGTQVRQAPPTAHIDDMEPIFQDLPADCPWPPHVPPVRVVLVEDLGLVLVDGFCRTAAAERASLVQVWATVEEGPIEEARYQAACANGKHGLKLTRQEKIAAIRMALAAKPKASLREIARDVSVSHNTVNLVKANMAAESAAPLSIAPETGQMTSNEEREPDNWGGEEADAEDDADDDAPAGPHLTFIPDKGDTIPPHLAECPAERVAEVVALKDDMESWHYQARALQDRLEAGAAKELASLAEARDKIKSVVKLLDGAVPYACCPKCQGAGGACLTCGGLGVVSRATWKLIDGAFKR